MPLQYCFRKCPFPYALWISYGICSFQCDIWEHLFPGSAELKMKIIINHIVSSSTSFPQSGRGSTLIKGVIFPTKRYFFSLGEVPLLRWRVSRAGLYLLRNSSGCCLSARLNCKISRRCTSRAGCDLVLSKDLLGILAFAQGRKVQDRESCSGDRKGSPGDIFRIIIIINSRWRPGRWKIWCRKNIFHGNYNY